MKGPAHLTLLLAFLVPLLVPAAEKPTYQPDFTQRFLLLAPKPEYDERKEFAALREQLQQAAAAGYRLVAASQGRPRSLRLILEKVAMPPDTYEYRVFDTAHGERRIGVEDLTAAAREGFRLLPWTLLRYEGDVLIIMEKTPGDSGEKYEYGLLKTKRVATLEKELNEVTPLGFRPVALMSHDRELVAFVERSAAAAAEAESGSPATAGEPYYRLNATRKLSTCEKELQEANARGYRPLMSTLFSGTFGTDNVVLLERAEAEAGHDYRLIQRGTLEELRQPLAQAGAEGFRLLPQTSCGQAFGSSAMLMGKVPAMAARFEYQIVSADFKDPASLQGQLAQVVEQGYRPVRLTTGGGGWKGHHEDWVILERPVPESNPAR